MAEANRVSCPFLGMDYDRNTCYQHIEELHRCYRDNKPAQIEPSVQAIYCIGPNYEDCKRWRSGRVAIDSSPRLVPSRNILLSVAIIILSFLAGRVFFYQEGPVIGGAVASEERMQPSSAQEGSSKTPAPTSTLEPGNGPGSVAAVKATATPQKARSHVVVRGDTLYSIAARYGTTIEAFVKANALPNTDIYVGQNLVIP